MDTGWALLRDALGRLTRFWPALVAFAAAGLLARELLLDLAVRAGRLSSVTGLLVLSLVPMASLLAFVAMLLVLRPSTIPPGRRIRRVLAAMASLIVPYLVVYEHYGSLDQDQRTFYYDSARDAFDQSVATGAAAADRVPEEASLAVIATVVGALLARSVLGQVLRRRRIGGADSLRRTGLQMVVGYAEVVWIFLGVFVVTRVMTGLSGWFGSRVAVAGIRNWWADVTDRFEVVGDIAAFLVPAGSLLVVGVVAGLIVPISWLCFGAVAYGTQPTDVTAAVTSRADGRVGRVMGRARRRVGDDAVDRVLDFTVDTGRRFGPLVAGLTMLRRAGWSPVLWFCLAYVVVGQLGYLVWGIARAVAGPQPTAVWTALGAPLEAVTTIVIQITSAALLAAAADTLVRRMGTKPAESEPGTTEPQPVGSSQ